LKVVLIDPKQMMEEDVLMRRGSKQMMEEDAKENKDPEKKKKTNPVVCCAIGEGIVGYVAASGERRYAADVYKDPYFSAGVDAIQGQWCRSTVCVALRAHGEVVGVLQVLKRNGSFGEDEVAGLEEMADQSGLSLSNSMLVQSSQTDNLQVIIMINYHIWT